MAREYRGYIIETFRHGYIVLVDENEIRFDTYREAIEFIDEELTK